MKKLLSLALLAAASTTLVAQSSGWNGTWKLNRAKSHMTGETYTVSKGENGLWVVSFGSLKFSYAPDGKPYPVFDNDHTLIATMADAHTLKSINQVKGKTTSTATDTLSADGKTISDVTINTRPDGSTYTTTETDTRVGTGEGFLGTWSSSKVDSSSDAPETITATADSITVSDPANKFSVTAKLDGTPATPTSPDMTAGVTISYKKVSAHKLTYTVSLKGKAFREGTIELAADGKSYTDVSWLISNVPEKTTQVYDKL